MEGRPVAPVARYAFRPGHPAAPPRETEARLRASLTAALRVGHGAGCAFRLEIAPGSAAPLRLAVFDPPARRWAERALLRAYPPGGWKRLGSDAAGGGQPRWVGRRRGLPSPDPAPWRPVGELLRAFESALRCARGGAELTVDLRAVRPGRLQVLDAWLSRPTVPERTGPRPRTRAGAPDHVTSRTPEPGAGALPLWRGTVELTLGSEPEGTGGASLCEALSGAATLLEGGRLEFARDGLRPQLLSGSLFREDELLALLPGPEDATAGSGERVPSASSLPTGRGAAGELIALPVETEQGRHFALLGETGMGKSSLLVALAVRAARLGGVVLFDPLGETAELLADELTRSGRSYLRVGPGVPGAETNVLEEVRSVGAADPVQGEREVATLVHALRRVRAGRFSDSAFWGPRLEEMLARAVRVAASLPGGTLRDAYELLAGAGGGRTVVPPDGQPALRELVARVRDRPEDVEGARRLLYEVVGNPTLAGLLCSRRPGLDPSELVRPGSVTLISGAAPTVGETAARYLLSTYLALVWSRLLARRDRGKTFVLLDEAQWFANEALGEMLRLARRGNVHVGVTTQSLASLPEDVREAIRTNVADLVVFRTGAEEARELGRANSALSPEALVALPRGEAAVLLGKGERLEWVRTARLPPAPRRRSGLGAGPERASGPSRAASPDGAEPSPVSEPCLPGPGATPGRSEELLEWLDATFGTDDASAPVAVPLAELRRFSPGDDRAIRSLGSELGRRGAILRTGRGANGPTWWLDRARLGPSARAPRTESESAADPSQYS